MEHPIRRSRFRQLKRKELERLCDHLAQELHSEIRFHDETDGDRAVETADEASSLGYQALAMAIDPSNDYLNGET